MISGKMTLGVIIGNRDFFPDRLCTEARQDVTAIFDQLGIELVMLDEHTTKLGAVETWEHAKSCGALFRQHQDEIDGILVVLPNFGDEKGVADSIKLSGLNVPIMIQAYPDDLDQFTVERRRDAYCGKISVCNNLVQYDFPFTLTEMHTVPVMSESFKADLRRFVAVCRIVNGLRNARIGAIGARPGNFNTTRYSEKLLEDSGISVITLDLSDVFGRAQRLADNDARVKAKLERIQAYVRIDGVPPEAIVKQAKLGVVVEEWMTAYDLNASAIQCWTSLQENFGVNVCTLMSMMSERLMPSACEVDITGTVAMYALSLATEKPTALVDWNN